MFPLSIVSSLVVLSALFPMAQFVWPSVISSVEPPIGSIGLSLVGAFLLPSVVPYYTSSALIFVLGQRCQMGLTASSDVIPVANRFSGSSFVYLVFVRNVALVGLARATAFVFQRAAVKVPRIACAACCTAVLASGTTAP